MKKNELVHETKAMGKKGEMIIIEFVFIAIGLIAVGITSMMMSKVVVGIDNSLSNSSMPGYVNQTVLDQAEAAITTMDSMIVVILIGWMLFVLVSAFFIDTHPALFILSLITLFVVMMPLAALSNIFETVAASSAMASETARFPTMIYVMVHLPEIFFILGILLIIVLFGKLGGRGGQA